MHEHAQRLTTVEAWELLAYAFADRAMLASHDVLEVSYDHAGRVGICNAIYDLWMRSYIEYDRMVEMKRQLLRFCPAGATAAQLWWPLTEAGWRARSEVCRELAGESSTEVPTR